MPTSLHGLLVIDKPSGITSREAVDRAARWLPPGTRLGHTGTLDPLASGVLVLCIGKANRLGEYVQRMVKTYRAGIQLGAASDTDDAEGNITAQQAEHPPEPSNVSAALGEFVGEIEQVPPAFSAAKVTGRRAYELARRGKKPILQARRIHIHDIELIDYAFPALDVVVRCSKGTYIRALARDLGARLGCGGYIASLRRTHVGPFDVGQAITLDTDAESALAHLLPLTAAVVELPRMTIPSAEITRLCHGQTITVPEQDFPDAKEAAIFDDTQTLVAIAALDAEDKRVKPLKVLTDDSVSERTS